MNCDTTTQGERDVEAEFQAAIDRIVQSKSPRKLVVAGPGTGKTTLFRKLLESASGDSNSRLVLTFINNLKNDLERSLSDLARVCTLHGYCQWLLRSRPELRAGLTSEFICLPQMASIIKSDWLFLRHEPPPHFVDLMRNLVGREELGFYLERANYYDAVDFDDSIYRTYLELRNKPEAVPRYDLVLIDEYQDFNRMEARFIETLAERNPIVVAGDDDQALYSQLRGASWDYIRSLYGGHDYEFFPLPFCMRCPEVIVEAVNDIITKAMQGQKLGGRIQKPYRHYEPGKGADSRLYPKIQLITATVQRKNANYFGRFIEAAIRNIPEDEIMQANERREPVVLIIGSRQYLRQIEEHLVKCSYTLDTGRGGQSGLELSAGLELLKKNAESNIGWRVILELKDSVLAASCVREATNKLPLFRVLPEQFRKDILAEAKAWIVPDTDSSTETGDETKGLTIKLTSFEGAKGLSAQHVFIVGLHAGDLPRDPNNIQDLEICKFLVGLTRTKKQCALFWTKRFANDWKEPSPFLRWIRAERYDAITVDAKYWASQG